MYMASMTTTCRIEILIHGILELEADFYFVNIYIKSYVID